MSRSRTKREHFQVLSMGVLLVFPLLSNTRAIQPARANVRVLTPQLRMAWEKRRELERRTKEIKEQELAMREAKRQEKIAARKRREEQQKRREENARKNEVVQVVRLRCYVHCAPVGRLRRC